MKRSATNITWLGGLIFIVVLVGTVGSASCRKAAAENSSGAPEGYTAEQVARGQYLVTIGGCNDCHTPWKDGPEGPEPDMTRMLSGHPENLVVTRPAAPPGGEWQDAISVSPSFTSWSGPWGVSFTANLTPDQNTGLGIWTEDIFMNALRTGKHFGVSRPILPPMPWFNYAKMTDEDLRSVFAYLRSIPPVKNRVPEPIPPTETTH